ncbi:MAG TPA: DUF1707 domain-containing protein [Solirubrobacteraceae bacterium]|jgi:hypothetical protein|nr:DUF1707 domain-containing protein [Solirubrobacteraceae bacterium]
MPTRASDAERERCARSLRDHAATGRLDVDELEERLARAYGARYRSDLRALLRDLPREHGRRAARAADRIDRALLKLHAWSFAAVNAGLAGVWAGTGEGYYWPVFLLAPWGVMLGGHAGASWGVRRMLRQRVAGELPRGGGRRRLAA